MKTISTYNAFHLGDNLVHLNFLRRCAQKYPEIAFTHTSRGEHFAQLQPLVADLPNLTLYPDATPHDAIDAWRGAEGHWYAHPLRNNFLAYHLDWFRHLAAQMGLESPITCAADMLFDYPAVGPSLVDAPFYDLLIVNSQPNSGQWSGFSAAGFDDLVAQLIDDGHRVLTTAPTATAADCTQLYFPHPNRALDVTAIGRLSQRVKCIIGCVTGPMWPTFNIWAKPALRLHLLDHERVELTANTVHANSLSLVPEILAERGLL
jgi:hypothetical protein